MKDFYKKRASMNEPPLPEYNNISKTEITPPPAQPSEQPIKKLILSILGVVISIPAAFCGYFLWIFDGYCAGGHYCDRPPSLLALLGSFVMSLSVVFFFSGITKTVLFIEHKNISYSQRTISKIIISIIVLTIILFIFRYFIYAS